MALTFGVHTGQQNCSLEELRRLWRYVDQAGFDWLSVWDHFYEAPPIDGNGSCFETVSALTLLAADTAKVRVGCLVFCINYRQPAVLAKAFATIDHVSNGRLEAGLGAGWHEQEYRAVTASPSSRSACAKANSKRRCRSSDLCSRMIPPPSRASTFACTTRAAILNPCRKGSRYGLAVAGRSVPCAPPRVMLTAGISPTWRPRSFA